jgi:hypothetical protein
MLRDKLEFIKTRMKQYYDKHRLKGPRLERGDKVYLTLRNLHISRPSRKLDFKKIRPFRIDEQVSSNNYRLSLPATMRLRIYVFYISLLGTSTKERTACYGYRSRRQRGGIGRRGSPRLIRHERTAAVFSKVVGFRARRQLIATSYEPPLPREA